MRLETGSLAQVDDKHRKGDEFLARLDTIRYDTIPFFHFDFRPRVNFRSSCELVDVFVERDNFLMFWPRQHANREPAERNSPTTCVEVSRVPKLIGSLGLVLGRAT